MATLSPITVDGVISIPADFTTVGTSPYIGEVVASTDNATSYFHGPDIAVGNRDAIFDLAATPTDFASMDSLNIDLRLRTENALGDDLNFLEVRILTSDSGTVLAGATSTVSTAFQRLVTNLNNTSWADLGDTAFTYVNTTATKTQWDGARLEFRVEYDKTKGPNAGWIAISSAEINGAYTTGDVNVTGTATATFGGTFAATGTAGVTGTAAATFGGTFDAATTEVRHGDAVAAGAFGGTFDATGTAVVTGTATATFGGAFDATGTVSSGNLVTGTATATFGGTFTGAGTAVVTGVAAAAFGGLAPPAVTIEAFSEGDGGNTSGGFTVTETSGAAQGETLLLVVSGSPWDQDFAFAEVTTSDWTVEVVSFSDAMAVFSVVRGASAPGLAFTRGAGSGHVMWTMYRLSNAGTITETHGVETDFVSPTSPDTAAMVAGDLGILAAHSTSDNGITLDAGLTTDGSQEFQFGGTHRTGHAFPSTGTWDPGDYTDSGGIALWATIRVQPSGGGVNAVGTVVVVGVAAATFGGTFAGAGTAVVEGVAAATFGGAFDATGTVTTANNVTGVASALFTGGTAGPVTIAASDIDPADPTGLLLSPITAGDLVLVATTNRSGQSVIGDGVTETGSGTYVEEASHIEDLGNTTYRFSSALWSLLAPDGSVDTAPDMAGDAQSGAGLVLTGVDGYDWANREVVSVDDKGASITSITSPATSSLSGDYLAIVMVVVKEDSNSPDWSTDLLIDGNAADSVVEQGSAGFNAHYVFGVYEGTFSGTITATAGESTNPSTTTAAIYLIVVPKAAGAFAAATGTVGVTGVAAATFGGAFAGNGTTVVTGVASAVLGATFDAATTEVRHGDAVAAASFGGTFDATGTVTSGNLVTGVAAATFGGAFAGNGTAVVEGVASAVLGATFDATGTRKAVATAAGTFGATFDAAGTVRGNVTGTAAATFGGTFAAVGEGRVVATAAASFGGAFDAVGVTLELGTATASFGGTFDATGTRKAVGTATATFGGTFAGAGEAVVEGVATATFGGTFDAVGDRLVEGVAGGTFGGTFTGTGTVSGNIIGTGAASFGGAFAAVGDRLVEGVASADLGGTFDATGTVSGNIIGTGAATFGGAFDAVGDRLVEGTATASFGGTFTSNGEATIVGTATASFGGTFAAVGEGRAVATAAGAFGGTFTANGTVTSGNVVTGVASADLGGTFTAVGEGRAVATAAATFGGTFTATGDRLVAGTGSATFGATFTAVGAGRVVATATATFGGTFAVVVDPATADAVLDLRHRPATRLATVAGAATRLTSAERGASYLATSGRGRL